MVELLFFLNRAIWSLLAKRCLAELNSFLLLMKIFLQIFSWRLRAVSTKVRPHYLQGCRSCLTSLTSIDGNGFGLLGAPERTELFGASFLFRGDLLTFSVFSTIFGGLVGADGMFYFLMWMPDGVLVGLVVSLKPCICVLVVVNEGCLVSLRGALLYISNSNLTVL